MKKLYRHIIPAVFLLLGVSQVQASSVTLPNTFSAGTPAKAAEVNANFSAVKSSVDDNQSQIAALKAQIATLQKHLSQVNDSQVMALDQYLTVDTTSDPRGPLVQLSGVNVQLVNGENHTDSANGLGNLIIGYDEADTSGVYRCTVGTDSNGNPTTASTCGSGSVGGIWEPSFKTGSHYLIVGSGNNYSGYGGVVMGYENTSNGDFASVTGGFQNTASGYGSSVSGGRSNMASGVFSSASGGFANTASGYDSSVSGGVANTASGNDSSVSGGGLNTASGNDSSVSGGDSNTASGNYSSVLGGKSHTASTPDSTIPTLP